MFIETLQVRSIIKTYAQRNSRGEVTAKYQSLLKHNTKITHVDSKLRKGVGVRLLETISKVHDIPAKSSHVYEEADGWLSCNRQWQSFT